MLPTYKTVGIVLVYIACARLLFSGEVIAGEEKLQSRKYTSKTEQQAIVWQKELRSRFVHLLKMDDLVSTKTLNPLQPKMISYEKRKKYVFREIEINNTHGQAASLRD